MPQVSTQEFERLPLRVHTFLAGVPLRDVWSVDLPRWRAGVTLDEFSRTANNCKLDACGCSKSSSLFTHSPFVRVLLDLRFFVGSKRSPKADVAILQPQAFAFFRRDMETPLTPLEFARRARKLYPDRVAVIDGESRWSYAQFLDRCDRWSAVLQRLGVGAGDRIAYLAPNTHAQLESFYSVPQLGAVLVPLNFRLTADDFLYLINHS